MSLNYLLEALPKITEDGTYFELRKISTGSYKWSCVETNMRTNKDHFSNIGRTPEEAVWKMLVRKGIKKGCVNCLHSYKDHPNGRGCILCQCKKLNQIVHGATNEG